MPPVGVLGRRRVARAPTPPRARPCRRAATGATISRPADRLGVRGRAAVGAARAGGEGEQGDGRDGREDREGAQECSWAWDAASWPEVPAPRWSQGLDRVTRWSRARSAPPHRRGRRRHRRPHGRPGSLAAAGRAVTVLEASSRIGGKLRTETVGGVAVDVGAEAMLARRPEGTDLVARARPRRRAPRHHHVGDLDPRRAAPAAALGDGRPGRRGRGRARRACSPTPGSTDSGTRSPHPSLADRRGRLRRRPGRGPPRERGRRPAGRAAARRRVRRPRAAAVRPRDRAPAGRLGGRLPRRQRGAARWPPRPERRSSPAIPGGLGRLPEAVAAGLDVRTGATVRALRRTPRGFALVVGPTTAAEEVEADEVVLATPGAATARLLADVAPAAAAELAAIEYASMAIVTLAFRAEDLAGLTGSGFLVPPVDGRDDQGRRRSRSTSGTGCARPAAAPWCCGPRSGGTARSRRSRCPTRTWSPRPYRPPRRHRHRRRPARHPRAALGWCAPAVRRRPPRPRRPDPSSRGGRAGAGGVRGGVRRRRHPGRDRVGPPGRGFARPGRMKT